MSWLNLRKKKEETKAIKPSAPLPAKKLAVREEKTPAAVSAKASPRASESLGVSSARPIRVAAGSGDATAILRPRVTEKAAALAARAVYAFEVTKGATERTVKAAIHSLYKVSPVKVAFVPLRRKEIIVKGKKGRTKGGKKAYVFLKAGDKIEVL